jgi:hypothetical protein
VARSFAGQEVTDDEQTAFGAHPETAFKLLEDIPRFDRVASIVRAQQARAPAAKAEKSTPVAGEKNAETAPAKEPSPWANRVNDDVVELGILLLRAAIQVEALVAHGASHKMAVAEIRLDTNRIRSRGDAAAAALPRVLAALETYRVGSDGTSVVSLPVAQLTVGMTTDEDVLAISGSVIVPKGTELGSLTLERLRKFALGIGVREPVRVKLNA